MSAKINRLVVFPGTKRGSWVFRVSISNMENIMVMAFCTDEPRDMILRFFTNEENAAAFIDEVAMNKHSP